MHQQTSRTDKKVALLALDSLAGVAVAGSTEAPSYEARGANIGVWSAGGDMTANQRHLDRPWGTGELQNESAPPQFGTRRVQDIVLETLLSIIAAAGLASREASSQHLTQGA